MATAREIGKAIIQTGQRLNPTGGGAMRRVLDLAIDGVGSMPGARQLAANHLGKKLEREEAIDAIVTQHVGLAGAQGFATNIGGFVAMALAVPANLAGATIIQCRMVASIAHLRGYDLDDNRVRSAVLMCLLGEELATQMIHTEVLPSTPMAVATAPAFDADLDHTIGDQVLAQLLTQVGGKKIGLLFGKKIPLIGGGVGAVTDSWQTFSVARYARQEFPDRRR